MILAASIFFVLVAQAPAEGTPRVLFAEKRMDFGVMEQLTVKTQELLFLNDGDGDLVIRGLTPNCDCTPMMVSKNVIPPGEEGRISITLSADLEAGRKEGAFLVHTNDPENPDARIEIVAEVEPAYRFEPRVLNFGVHREGDPLKTLSLDVSPVKAKSLVLRAVECSSPHFAVAWEKRDEEDTGGPAHTCTVRVRMKEGIPPGRFKARLTLVTDHPRIAEWSIPLIGVVEGAARMDPTLVTLGTVKRGETPSATLRVTGDGKGLLDVIRVDRAEDYFDARIETVKEGMEYKITISLKPDAPAGFFDKRIVVHSRTPEAQSFKARILGIVR
jgi:hypothetical protein